MRVSGNTHSVESDDKLLQLHNDNNVVLGVK
jgi:hypothetical protein